jgi:hypothetical protein
LSINILKVKLLKLASSFDFGSNQYSSYTFSSSDESIAKFKDVQSFLKIPLLMHVGELASASVLSPFFRKPYIEVIFSLEIVNLHLETRNLSLDGLWMGFNI